MEDATPRDQAWILEQSACLGTCFMGITPNANLSSTIPSDTYRLALRWWLGMPILDMTAREPSLCPGCRAELDAYGDHLLCCPRNNYNHRHAAVQESLATILSEAGQPFAREVTIPLTADGQLRPADLLLRAWSSGQDTAVDVTICHGWQSVERSTVATPATREKWRAFLVRKEKAKKHKYDEACRRSGWAFLPMAFGTWGGMGPEAAKVTFRVLKRAAGWLEGDLRAGRQEEMRLQLGLALMRHIWSLLETKNQVF